MMGRMVLVRNPFPQLDFFSTLGVEFETECLSILIRWLLIHAVGTQDVVWQRVNGSGDRGWVCGVAEVVYMASVEEGDRGIQPKSLARKRAVIERFQHVHSPVWIQPSAAVPLSLMGHNSSMY